MKNNKALYYICKGINWTNWFITLAICYILPELFKGTYSDSLYGYGFIVFIGNILFVVFWFMFSSTRSRIVYQIWFFLGYIFAEYCMFYPVNIGFIIIDANITQKIILTILCIGMFASKIYTMSYETGEYKAGSTRRYNNKWDEKIYSATYELEHAKTYDERQRAQAKLERAKLDKERYSINEDDYK